MTAIRCPVKTVTRAEITFLVDNHVDLLLQNQRGVIRPLLGKEDKTPVRTLRAEHGLSLLLDAWAKDERHRTLLDTGYNSGTVVQNIEMLGVSPDSINALVPSHGHMDHVGSVDLLLAAIGKPVPVYCHPYVFLPRFTERPKLGLLEFPQLIDREQIIDRGGELLEGPGPVLLSGKTVLATGEVPRLMRFEKGIPGARIKTDSGFEQDNIEDDQSLVVNVDGCGIVVISG